MQKNFNNQKTNLSEQDIDQLVAIICHRCRVATYTRVRSILTYMPSQVKSYGILDRLIKEENKDGSTYWSYCAGQDYTSEIKTVLNCILKG